MDALKEYAKLGLVHHMLYAAALADADAHADTLAEFVKREDIETLDCCIPYGESARTRAINAVRNCGKEVCYALHLFPLRKISLAARDNVERWAVCTLVRDQVKVAAAAGVTAFIIASGQDAPPDDRPAAIAAFADFCRWFCRELKPFGIVALLEPFDRDFDKRFLYGSTRECVELIESLKPEIDNFGIELDIAHLPMMHEDITSAVHTCGQHIKRVHLGNCMTGDPSSPWYGDTHPPVGFPGGEIDTPQIAEFLRALLDIGFLSKQNRGSMLFEFQCISGVPMEETVKDNMARLQEAWTMVCPA